MNATLVWNQQMNFTCENRGLKVDLDATIEHGGQNLAPSPKELLLNAMMGCTAMDVVMILKKMRQELQKFSMNIEVEKNLDHPVHFKTAILTFNIEGDVSSEKAIKAVESSLTKYCGVNYIVSKTCDISYIIKINGLEVGKGKAHFEDPKN